MYLSNQKNLDYLTEFYEDLAFEKHLYIFHINCRCLNRKIV